MATSSHNVGHLHDAVEIFNLQSGLLQQRNRDLEDTVEALTLQLQRDERLTSIGEMTAEFAHQVRTPLSSAMLYAGQLDTTDARQSRIARKIIRGLNDLRRMVNDMLGFAAGARADQSEVSVLQILNEVSDAVNGQIAEKTTVTVCVSEPTLTVRANKDAIKGALINLVMNADQVSENGAHILMHGHRFGGDIHLCVTDDGPGIPADVRPRLFEAFFTTRPQGTGLGLSVVEAVTSAHNGNVMVETSPLGSSFTLRIPADPSPTDPGEDSTREDSLQGVSLS